MNVNNLEEVNPFADPSVLEAQSQRFGTAGTAGATSALDDYNPFENLLSNGNPRPPMSNSGSLGSTSRPLGADAGVSVSGALGGSVGGLPSATGGGGGGSSKGYGSFTNLDTASNSAPGSAKTSPPAYSTSGAQFLGGADGIGGASAASTEELRRRQAELDAKAQELQRREEELQRQQLLQNQSGRRDNNWPPLPTWIPVQPCFYQDISVEIPVEFQKIVTLAYRLWMFHILVLLLNFIGSLSYFIGDPKDGGGEVFGLSILFIVLFTPCSFVCWFRPLYKAFKSDSSINFMIFFFVFGVQSFSSCLQTIGFDYFGTVGFISSIRMFGKGGIFAGVIMLLVSFALAFQALGDVILLLRVHRLYRSNSTASVSKARQEFTSEVMKNKEVQNLAARGAMSAATGTMSP